MHTLDQEAPEQMAPAPPAGDVAVLNQMLITLVESRSHREGSRYEPLASWPLDAER